MGEVKSCPETEDNVVSDAHIFALVAAGGNSRLARSIRARLQWRDRYGRWIEMGRGLKFKVRGADGAPRSVIGSFVGAIDDKTGQVYVTKDPNGIPDGFYDVSSSNAQEFVANLNQSQLAERGIELGKDATGNAVGERAAEDIPNINELKTKAAPEGWSALPGTYAGKKVIETEDGDFRLHFAGKDDGVLLEDHRGAPGQAQEQRSVAEAFKKISDVDVEREESGDSAYKALSDDNDAKLASRTRDDKVEQIKANERTLLNDRAALPAKQAAMDANNTLKKELEDEGQPYDPEGNDSDEALAARKAAPGEETVDPTKPSVSAGDIDVSTFDVSPEGFLVPTGKKTNDISPEGLANFMTAEKESLGKGGARLVVDSDQGTAEIHNSADTLDNAKAQAGGLGQDTVLDLAAGKPVSVSDGAVDPNSPDVNPNLNGDTSPEAPNAEDRNPDAVEPGRADTGADAPAGSEPDAEARERANAPSGAEPAPAGGDASESDRGADTPATDRSGAAPGSVEELKERRAKVQAALDNAGDPKDIIALNEQADALDTRISALEGSDVDIQARVREDGGLSVSLDGLEPTDGFMVAVQGHNREIPEDEFFDSEAGPLALKNWIDQNLSALEKPGAHIGIWHDTENREVVLDISERVESREEAERLGIERNQQAIWDVAGGKEIDTGGTGDRAEEVRPDSGELPGDERGGEARVREGDSSQDRAAGDTDGRVEDRLTEIAENIAELQREFEAAEARYNASTSEEGDRTAQTDIDRLFNEIADLEDQFNELNSRERSSTEGEELWAANPSAPTAEEIKAAPVGSILAEEHNESGDQRLYRKRDDGRWEQLKRDGSGEPSGYVTRGDTFHLQGSRSHYASDMEGTRPVDPEVQRRRDEQMSRIEEPETSAPERDTYQEPGDSDAAATARAELDAIDAEIEEQLTAAEGATDPQVEAEHLSRVRTLERQRKIQENALNRALGNSPMDFNGELGWNMRDPENRGSLPEAPEAPETTETRMDTPDAPEEAPEDVPVALDTSLEAEDSPETEAIDLSSVPEDTRTPEQKLSDAEDELADAERAYSSTLLRDDYTDEEYEEALDRREFARAEVRRLEEDRDYKDAAQMEEEEMYRDAEEAYGPDLGWDNLSQEISDNIEKIDNVATGEGGGVVDRADDPNRVSPGHENRVSAAKARLQGKDLSDEDRSALESALDSESLSDNQLSRLESDIDSRPNRANTTTVARPEQEQPEFLSSADVDIVNAEREDPSYVFDEDLTWRKILEEHPDAVQMENGDLMLDTYSKTNGAGTKRYDVLIRRTKQNRFMVYLIETDQNGNRRGKRVGNTEWHSYEAVEKRITRGRKLASGARPSSFFANNKETPTENLGVQGFPEDDFLGDIGNPEAAIPATGDARYDHLLEIVANHIRNGDADIHDIEAHLQQVDPGSGAIRTIMQAVIGRAQDSYRPNGTNPFQMYDGETAEIGMEFDWTDWHQELDWWLPNGQLNPNRRPNPSHGTVHRGRVVGYVKENTDGKGEGKSHTYGDHVWVQLQDPQTGAWGKWVKRSAQTLRRADEGSPLGLPFFSKREEWRSNPEALARRFRVPNAAADEPVVTHERPNRDLPQSRRLRFTSRGTLSGYSNVPVPTDQPSIAGMIHRGEIRPQIRPASEARPGMMVVRMDDEGNQYVDSIIRVENIGDGGYRIHAARPDGNGYADVDSFVVPGDADIAIWTAPGLPAPATKDPKNARRGELVEFDRDGVTVQGVVLFDDDRGNLTIAAPGNETIDILESNIRPVEAPEVSQEDRMDLVDGLDDHDIPQYIKNMIMQGLLSPGLSKARYDQLVDIVRSFGSRSAKIRDVDTILDMIGATDQQRADVHAYFNAPE